MGFECLWAVLCCLVLFGVACFWLLDTDCVGYEVLGFIGFGGLG